MKMSYREARRDVTPYLEGKLNDREMAAFLNHIGECPKCYHELETSFIIQYALKHMDDATDRSFDMKNILKEHIRRSERMLRRRRIIRLILDIVGAVLAAVAVLVLLHILFPHVIDPVYYLERFLAYLKGLF